MRRVIKRWFHYEAPAMTWKDGRRRCLFFVQLIRRIRKVKEDAFDNQSGMEVQTNIHNVEVRDGEES